MLCFPTTAPASYDIPASALLSCGVQEYEARAVGIASRTCSNASVFQDDVQTHQSRFNLLIENARTEENATCVKRRRLHIDKRSRGAESSFGQAFGPAPDPDPNNPKVAITRLERGFVAVVPMTGLWTGLERRAFAGHNHFVTKST